jgi:hypothetical protein
MFNGTVVWSDDFCHPLSTLHGSICSRLIASIFAITTTSARVVKVLRGVRQPTTAGAGRTTAHIAIVPAKMYLVNQVRGKSDVRVREELAVDPFINRTGMLICRLISRHLRLVRVVVRPPSVVLRASSTQPHKAVFFFRLNLIMPGG